MLLPGGRGVGHLPQAPTQNVFILSPCSYNSFGTPLLATCFALPPVGMISFLALLLTKWSRIAPCLNLCLQPRMQGLATRTGMQ